MSSALDNNYKVIHIDYASYLDGAWYMSGWLVSEADMPVISVSIEDEDNALVKVFYEFFERDDLITALNLPDTVNAYGFTLVAERSESDFTKLVFKIDNKEIVASSLEPVIIDSPDVILAALGAKKASFLRQVQEGLNSTLDTSDKPTEPTSIRHYFDLCIITDSNLLYFNGWALTDGAISDIIVEDEEGKGYQVTECFRYLRTDINTKFGLADNYNAGMVCACRLPTDFLPEKLIIKASENRIMTSGVDSSGSSQLSKTKILKDYLSFVNVHKARFFDNGQPAILRHLADIWQGESIMDNLLPEVGMFGEVNVQPTVSVIIPIYGRYDFLQHQLLAFSNDADMQNHEIIYVLDDPRIEREFNIMCHGVFNTFDHPFKTIHAGKNLGFAGANNLGASIATGKYILALNSDVMPSNKGWLGRLAEKFSSLDSPGILGTKLVYEDETIQHIGMVFQDDAYYPGIWMNYHPHKGMPSHLINKKETELTELVTGACMLMEKEFFISVGGFDTRYILGDFEDSDLCLKAYQHNKKIYIDTKESLYHLERLSQNLVDSGDWKYKLTLLNGLYQKDKWGDAIEEVKQQNV
ncbi:glycosyltransferase [Pseudoalteromonas sp. SR41-7]|uniref:glycosyltransferase family 2 protein n=1 Tax=Pseudoalteromonas sp. SR41-7 TaxID=2760947 RepID=UPI00160394F5|nr:glycosyltransferase [Pseudoalteromonas sp. SR41-7]MBB1296290.1 glycosyltransferase family 2 protein [Pseudoalteromonas sp. SR41-7]